MKTKSTRIVILALIVLIFATACGSFTAAEAVFQPVSQAESSADQPTANNPISTLIQSSPTAQTAPIDPALDIDSSLLEQENAFVRVFEQVNPAVVHIGVGDGQGSGFVIDQAGYIVTNNHVIAGATTIIATFHDGSQRDAELVGTDPDSDLAILKVNAQPGELTAVPLGNSDQLRVGQIVVAIGSPFGLESTLTTGVISGLNRLFPANGSYNIPDIIQTDAAINPGNSGGPLLDLKGRVIGVNTAIESPVRGSSGVGFAVPSNVVAKVAPQLIEGGRVAHPWLGISGTELNIQIARSLGLDEEQRGIMVASVAAGGPAARAGLIPADPATNAGGDIIVAIDSQPVVEFDDLLGYIVQETAVGQTVNLQVIRDGSTKTVPVTMGERPSNG